MASFTREKKHFEFITQLKKLALNKVSKFDSAEENLVRNGGIFLEKQLAISRGQNTGSMQLKTLSIDEIEKATNNYDPNLLIASNQSNAYKGIIDDKVVAIKVSKWQFNHFLIDFNLTESGISMVMNHDNLVKIYGCCLETYIPITVYEYLPNGTLYEHLHSKGGNLKWCDRLRVATDSAYALSYMHTALSRPVVHRNVQPRHILLDESFRAKLSCLGFSVTLAPGETSQIRPVFGPPGYTDPEYIETEKVSEKCDVYSFGVLLLELLTGKEPFMMDAHHRDLIDVFVSSEGKIGMTEIIDIKIWGQAKDTEEIRQVARLALKCVAKKGVERPTMVDVVQELWHLQQYS